MGYPPQTSYSFTVHRPVHLALGLLFLAAGAAAFAWAVWRHRMSDIQPEPAETLPVPVQATSHLRALLLVLSLMSAILFCYALVGMALEGYRALWGWLLLAAFILAGIAFSAHDRSARVRWWQPVHWWEAGFIALVAAAFIALNSFDLNNWYYSAIGDEYPFFNEARRIADGGDFNPFSQAGVFGDQPVLSSAFQALGMRIFGVDYFGWKFGSILTVALSFPFFYLLVSRLWGWRTGVFATTILASSHLLFGYAHTGYNNVQALPIALAAFWLFFAGHGRRSWLLLFLACATMGLGFYTIYMGRIGAVVLVFFVLLVYRTRPPLWVLVPSLVGGVFALAPLLVVNELGFFTLMLDRSAVGYEPAIVGHPVLRMLQNIPINLIAFNYNVQPHHYVSGSLLAPASAILAVLGLGALAADLRSRRVLFLVVWWAVGMVATGVFSPYPYVSPSRIHYLAPCYAIAAGVALNHLLWMLDFHVPMIRRRWVLLAGAGVGALALVLALNLYRFWEQSPRTAPIAKEAVAVRAVSTPACTQAAGTPIIVGGNAGLFRDIFGSSGFGPVPRQLVAETLLANPTQEGESASCIILMDPVERVQTTLANALREDSRVWKTEFITDYSGARRVLVFFPESP